MIKQAYRYLHRLASQPDEKGQYSGGYWQDKVRQAALSFCRNLKGRIIEIGCGEGLFLRQLALQNPNLEIWGIDNDYRRLELARENLDHRDAFLLCRQADNLLLSEEYFDAVICVNVFLNLPSFEYVKNSLTQMQRICKRGGRIIFDFRNALNPLLALKFRLARLYDDTVKDLPLNVYYPTDIEEAIKEMHLIIRRKKYIGFPVEKIAPVLVIETEKC